MVEADRGYSVPRLAAIYDPLDPDRSDLDPYIDQVAEVGAESLLDVGSGTGVLACLLAGRGLQVTGVDPALASIEVARAKDHGHLVKWIHGVAEDVSDLGVDMATMTANVAQVFLTESSWRANLAAIRSNLRVGGLLMFETRRPERRAWEGWTRDATESCREIEGEGLVRSWIEVTGVDGQMVSFVSPVIFEKTGETLTSESTLIFRTEGQLRASLIDSGFQVEEIREAPDRPGREMVFLAKAV